jgi:hypothetical protein
MGRRWWVAEALQNALDVAWNGDVNNMIGIVPFNSKATIISTSPILTQGIQLLQCLHEALGIDFVGVFDTNVINNKSKDKIRVGVFPQSRCDRHRDVAMWGKECGEAIICNSSSLGEAVHSFADFDIDMVAMHKRRQLVFGHNEFRDDRDRNLHIFILGCASGVE